MNHEFTPAELGRWFEHLSHAVTLERRMPEDDTPIGQLTREFLTNNWENCRRGLLQKTSRIRVTPEPLPAPCVFAFEVDRPYKSKPSPDAPVELKPGPIRGTIYFRPDVFVNDAEPAIAVALDRDQAFFHPNFSRTKGFLCLGELPERPFPFPLDLLLENLIYPIVTYQNYRPVHPFDLEAAEYFASAPEALHGLEPVEPLY